MSNGNMEVVTCKVFIHKLHYILSGVYKMKYYMLIKFCKRIAIVTIIMKIFTYKNLEPCGNHFTHYRYDS